MNYKNLKESYAMVDEYLILGKLQVMVHDKKIEFHLIGHTTLKIENDLIKFETAGKDYIFDLLKLSKDMIGTTSMGDFEFDISEFKGDQFLINFNYGEFDFGLFFEPSAKIATCVITNEMGNRLYAQFRTKWNIDSKKRIRVQEIEFSQRYYGEE
jgi:hypothetical protein